MHALHYVDSSFLCSQSLDKTVELLQTRVLVTHGLSYLPKVDHIIVVVEGRVSESGTYQELLNKQGAFADVLKMYITQEDEDEDKLSLLDKEGLYEVLFRLREVSFMI